LFASLECLDNRSTMPNWFWYKLWIVHVDRSLFNPFEPFTRTILFLSNFYKPGNSNKKKIDESPIKIIEYRHNYTLLNMMNWWRTALFNRVRRHRFFNVSEVIYYMRKHTNDGTSDFVVYYAVRGPTHDLRFNYSDILI